MKKPTQAGESDEKRGHTEEAKDEFRKLEQQYDSASIEERDRLNPDFIQAIHKKHPGHVEEIWRALRNGDSLKATLRYSMKRVLDRLDLSVGRKTNAREDADAAMWLFDELQRQDLEPTEMRGHANELATRTLFIGLRAGLRREEIDGLYERLISHRQQTLSHRPKKKKPWFWYARMLALKISEKDRLLSNAKIAERLWDDWAKEKPAEWAEKKPTRPSFDTLADFVGEFRADGTLPPGPTRARRPHD